MCVAGARWVQHEILAKHSSKRLRVYAVWFNMFPGDSRAGWPKDLISDPRVVHYWDEAKLVGTWFGRHPDYLNSNRVLWDAFILYGVESHWEENPTHRVSMGRTIVSKREELRRSIVPLLNANP